MEDIILSWGEDLPEQLWLLSGWMFIIIGGVVFCLGVIEKNQEKGKKMTVWGVFGIFVGGVAVFIPGFPKVALIAIMIVIILKLLLDFKMWYWW